MAEVYCDLCGRKFMALTKNRRMCTECFVDQYRSTHEEEKKPATSSTANQKIIEAVREVTKLGLSYGEYKGRKL